MKARTLANKLFFQSALNGIVLFCPRKESIHNHHHHKGYEGYRKILNYCDLEKKRKSKIHIYKGTARKFCALGGIGLWGNSSGSVADTGLAAMAADIFVHTPLQTH